MVNYINEKAMGVELCVVWSATNCGHKSKFYYVGMPFCVSCRCLTWNLAV